jgi:hypothetical protein
MKHLIPRRPQTIAALPVVLLWLCSLQPASCFYNPSSGKWLSRDPIEERGGKNVSGFVRNDPIKSVDVCGRWRLVMESIDAPHETTSCGGAESHVRFRMDFAAGKNGWLIQHLKFHYDVKNCDNSQKKDLRHEYWEAWHVVNGVVYMDFGDGVEQLGGDDFFGIPDQGDDTKGVLKKEGYIEFYEDYDLEVPPWRHDVPGAGGLPARFGEPFPWADSGKLHHFLQANYDCCCGKINIVTGVPWW